MLLTLDEARGLGNESSAALEDESLQLLLDAAEAEITRYAGSPSSVQEYITAGGHLITLQRQASSLDTVTETSWTTPTEVTTLDPDDYLVWPGGYVVERQRGGTNPRSTWFGRVAVTYVPEDDLDIRKGVQADLVNLMTNYAPGLTSETVGAWTTQLASNSVWNNADERASILSRLHMGGRMAVVGG